MATPTVRYIAEILCRKLDLGPTFASGLRNSEGPYFRGLFSIGTTIMLWDQQKCPYYSVCPLFRGVRSGRFHCNLNVHCFSGVNWWTQALIHLCSHCTTSRHIIKTMVDNNYT